MAAGPDELPDWPPPTPAPPDLVERATDLVRTYPECFRFWTRSRPARSMLWPSKRGDHQSRRGERRRCLHGRARGVSRGAFEDGDPPERAIHFQAVARAYDLGGGADVDNRR